MRYFEDVEVGSTSVHGSYDVTAEEIKEFAAKYDPQPFHVEEEAAEESMFGELVASGWHTIAMCMRMINEHPEPIAALAGVGADKIRWREPVRAGDHLELHTEVLSKRPSEKHDDRGYVTTGIEAHNQHDEVVVSYETTALVKGRDYD